MDKNSKIVVIGLGGVGSWLLQGLTPFLAYRKGKDLKSLVLVDGDSYEEKNRSRQLFMDLGNKAEVQTTYILKSFPSLKLRPVPRYVSEDGVKDNTIAISQIIGDGDLVFSCVDNHKTRKIINNYCANLDTICLISGGNDLTDGNVQVYIREEGEDLTASLEKYHPELANPKDKAPFEMSCEQLAKSSPQLIFANLAVASIMLNSFYAIINGKFELLKSEIYFDILLNAAAPRERHK